MSDFVIGYMIGVSTLIVVLLMCIIYILINMMVV